MNKRINERFHIETDEKSIKIIKTSNGAEVGLDGEPLFLLRGRDIHAIPLLQTLLEWIDVEESGIEQKEAMSKVVNEFVQWKIQNYNKMKHPNSTRGK